MSRAADRSEPAADAALRRVVARTGVDDLVSILSELPAPDLTTLLLAVASRQAAQVTPAEIMRRFETDRFTRPATVSGRAMIEAVGSMVGALPPVFDLVELAPLSPLGTHSVLAPVHQDKVVITGRLTDVAADPTNALALVAAVRRRALLAADPRSPAPVRLAAVQRVTRAQLFDGPVSFAHFAIFGLVTAGRDVGNRTFETEALAQQCAALSEVVLAAGVAAVQISLTALVDDAVVRSRQAVDAALAHLGARATVIEDPDRASGRGYYQYLCFKVHALGDHPPMEVGDGGFVDWTQRLVGSRKERLAIAGIGVDRLALLADPP